MPLSDAMKAVLKGLGYSDAEITAMDSASTPAPTSSNKSTTSTKPSVTVYPSVYSKSQADSKVTDIFNKLLDRDPTADELTTWSKKLMAAQDKFAAKQTYTRKGKKAEQRSTGGLDEDYWLTTELSKNATYKGEIQKLAILDPKVRQKGKEKREYDAAVKAAEGIPAALAALGQNTSYGIALEGLKQRIRAAADSAGAELDEGTLLQIAQEAYDTNQDQDPVLFNTFVNKKLKIGPVSGQYKGEAADNYQKLFELGIDNGINLETDPRFKGQVSGWLTQITAGAPIANFETIIRNAAAEGQPAFVQALLKTGKTLRNIYGNYISRMADMFNVPESSIDLNDPLLKKVFTDKGGISFSDFDETLRKDARLSKEGKGDIASTRQGIVDKALALGVELTESDIDEILNTMLSLSLNASSPSIERLIRSKFNYTPGKSFGGEVGDTLIDLRSTAAANGIDLDAQFGGQLDSWVEQVLQGESINTFKNLIRQTAKIGMPENVAKLLDQGVDLETVYNPYRNLMAKVLEINPQSIQLDDPVLRSAITGEGEMSLYDYQRYLRKDPRWQYTDNAREEVSNITLQVLRDFGFQG